MGDEGGNSKVSWEAERSPVPRKPHLNHRVLSWGRKVTVTLGPTLEEPWALWGDRAINK